VYDYVILQFYTTHIDHTKHDGMSQSLKKKKITAFILKRLGHAVAQLVETLRYKPEGRGFDFRWYHWNFSLT